MTVTHVYDAGLHKGRVQLTDADAAVWWHGEIVTVKDAETGKIKWYEDRWGHRIEKERK